MTTIASFHKESGVALVLFDAEAAVDVGDDDGDSLVV